MGLLGGAPSNGICLYYIDAADGNVYRSKIGGTRKELVLKSRIKRLTGVRIDVTWPTPKTRGRLTIGGVPYGTGWTTLDECRPINQALLSAPEPPEVGPPAFELFFIEPGNAWQVRHEKRTGGLEPGNPDDSPLALVARKGNRTVRLEFKNLGGALVALAKSGHAVVQDGRDVLLWEMDTNRVSKVARARIVRPWLRNLDDKVRFVPIASALFVEPRGELRAGTYKWYVRSPDQLRAKPEHFVRAYPSGSEVIRR